MSRIRALSRHGASPEHRVAAVLLLSVCIASCAIPISYYDVTTYQNLTDLKAETTMLVKSFDTVEFAQNEARIQVVHLDFLKAYEYEKGKGADNSATMTQFAKILALFEDDLSEYQQNGSRTLGAKYFGEAAIVLGQAFDIAIATENSKNQDKN
jgi:hypothetical protein